MKYFPSLRPLGLKIRLMSLVALLVGLNAPVSGQTLDDLNDADSVTDFWAFWIANSEVTGPRFYLYTERDIMQSSWSAGSFQRGTMAMVLADGSVGSVWRDQDPLYPEEWDSDKDGWRDVIEEQADPPTDPFNPVSFPTVGTPDVFWTTLANGFLLPVNTAGSTAAREILPSSFPFVRLNSAPPASDLPRPTVFNDYSTQFYIVDQQTSQSQLYGISLYNYSKNYPNPGDVKEMENDLVEGNYIVEYPLIGGSNIRKGISATHRMVPNGSFTLGVYKKPTWLLRSAESIERLDTAPVPQDWVNGRLRFDPEIATTFTWDDLVANGLANVFTDEITIRIDDADGNQIWPPTDAGVTVSVSNPKITLKIPNMIDPVNVEENTLPATRNGFLVLQYSRNVSAGNSGDTALVTLRVPIEMRRSYASYKLIMWPGTDGLNDAISGPNADPDGDGLTNWEEFEQGSNPTVSTLAVSGATSTDITSSSATLGAVVDADPASPLNVTIYERGVVYAPTSANPLPVIDGAGVSRVSEWTQITGAFTFNVTGLTSNTPYSFRAYAITSLGTYYSSSVSTFSTLDLSAVTIPVVTTPTSSGITGVAANLGGDVTSDGNADITERGIVYSLTSVNDNPFIGGTGVSKVIEGAVTTGVFTVDTTGLIPGATYSFRAYAINSVGVNHSATIGVFSTLGTPTIISPTSSDITSYSATLGGNVTADGGGAILMRGVIFSVTATNADPVIGGAGVSGFLSPGTDTGIFTLNATLSPGENYSFKAFAMNSVGTSYTAVGTFSTPSILATVTSPTLSGITATSATLGADMTSGGFSPVTERGFVYSATASNDNPFVGGFGVTKITEGGTATGTFFTPVTGLTANTGYTFKAYATNSAGTAYSEPWAFFTTLPPLTVSSPTVADITMTTALLGGNIVSDEGTTVDERGVVFSSTNNDPEIGGSGVTKVSTSGTMGLFTVAVTALTADTDYYFKAYATNSAGTSYSDVSTFRTLPVLLLGLAQVQWVEESTFQLAAFSDGSTTEGAALAQPRRVPQFVYLKRASEAADQLNYQIESSSDLTNWLPVDQGDWDIVESAGAMKATWTAANGPPACIFFRVVASSR